MEPPSPFLLIGPFSGLQVGLQDRPEDPLTHKDWRQSPRTLGGDVRFTHTTAAGLRAGALYSLPSRPVQGPSSSVLFSVASQATSVQQEPGPIARPQGLSLPNRA